MKSNFERERQNALLRAYGYHWKKETVWALYSPIGTRVSTQSALAEIAKLQVHKPGHPSTLWADDLLSLSHPLVLVLDTETTGFGADAEVIDIALVDKYGEVYLDTLIQCQAETIPQEAMAIHRIHKSTLHDAPTFSQVWQQLEQLLAGHEIVIYNAEYDLRLLRQTAKRYDLELPPMQTHCLMQRYSAYVGQASTHSEGYRNMKLVAACYHFQIEQTIAHRALADAQASLEVLHKLATQSGENNEVAELWGAK